MTVSAIITTYRRKPSVVIRALRSVMGQTFHDIEVIVVDDSPVDYEEKEAVRQEVLNTCKEVIYLSTGGNKGATAARNNGIQEASGEYIAFLDDDDEWLPEKIERQLEGFTSDKIGLVYSGILINNEKDDSIHTYNSQYNSGMIYDNLLQKGNFIGSTSVPLIRKTCLEAVEGFDESLEARQDYDLYIRLAQRFEFNYVCGDYTVYHIHSGERISTNTEAKLKGTIRLIEKYADDLKRIPQAKLQLNRTLVIRYCALKRRKEALKVWVSIVKMKPLDIPGNMDYFLLALFPRDSRFIQTCFRLKHMIKEYTTNND